jgi:quinol-cytochrome oxidoreductase complex cytochrome b subunit
MGWLVRYIHAKWCFNVLYSCVIYIPLEVFIMAPSVKPRELLWNVGVTNFIPNDYHSICWVMY